MDAALSKLYRGDYSLLHHVEDVVAGPNSAPSGERGRELYAFLATTICAEGVWLSSAEADQDMRKRSDTRPSANAWTALCLLSTVSARESQDGIDCRAVLLALGLSGCRTMALDYYFASGKQHRYSLATFVCILANIFGCEMHDLLLRQKHIHYMEVTAIPTLNAGRQVARPSDDNAPAGGGPAPSLPAVDPGWPMSNRQGYLFGAINTYVNSRVPPGNGNASSEGHGARIQLRSCAAAVPLLGTSPSCPGVQVRRYRTLPKAPAVTPFAINPLYEPDALLGDDSVLVAQFPFPVVQFSTFYGLGCAPRIPGVASFHKRQLLTAGATTTVGAAAAPPQRARGPIGAGARSSDEDSSDESGTLEDADAAGVMALVTPSRLAARARLLAASEQTAKQFPLGPLAPPAPANTGQPSVGPAAAAVRPDAQHISEAQAAVWFADSSSPTAAAFNKLCLECGLLGEYLEEGQLLGWGDNRWNALGPLRLAEKPKDKRAGAVVPDRPLLSALSPLLPVTAPSPLAVGGGGDGTRAAPAATPGSSTFLTSMAALAAATTPARDSHCYAPTVVQTPSKVVSLACGAHTSYIITETGMLCGCGRADSGQLGISDRALRYQDSGAERFQKVILSKEEQVVAVFAGSATAAAVSADGYVYCWGNNAYGQCLRRPEAERVLLPIRFKTGRYKPLALSLGKNYGSIVFNDGVLGVWGHAKMLGVQLPEAELEPTLAADDSRCVRRVCHLRTPFTAPVAVLRTGPWHMCAVTLTGGVYTWGVGFEGRLGHGGDLDEATPRIIEALAPVIAVEASCGAVHTAVVSSAGDVFVFGDNKHSQLGLRGDQPRRAPHRLELPAPAIAVSCGQKSTLILLESGHVMACGDAAVCGAGLGHGRCFLVPSYVLSNYVTLLLRSGPSHTLATVVSRTTALMRIGHSPIEELSRMESLVVRSGVRDVAVGVGFVLVLSCSGTMVGLGRGERGQLGIGPAMRPKRAGEVTVISAFEKVRAPAGAEFLAVSCGPDYALAIDRTTRVFGWGSNESEALTLPADSSGGNCFYEPTVIPAYEGRGVVQIACGAAFVAALTEHGEVFTHGEYACCGLSSTLDSPARAANRDGVRVLRPTPVRGLRNIVAIAAGREHGVALSAACVVYAWGKGVLGNGASAAAPSLSLVAYAPVKVALSQAIRTIGCGPLNSFAITDAGDLYVWGGNEHGQCGVAHSSTLLKKPATAAAAATTAAAAAAAVVEPTVAARGVRDAAFSTKFGIVLLEGGAVRATGTLRQGGRNYTLASFADGPQPIFSVDVNSAQSRRRATSQSGGAGGGVSDTTRSSAGNDRVLAAGEAFFRPARNPLSLSLPGGPAGATAAAAVAVAPTATRASSASPRIATGGDGGSPFSSLSRLMAGPVTTGNGADQQQQQQQRRLCAKGTETASAPPRSSIPKVPPTPPPPPPQQQGVGLKCFGGWDQVFAVLEKHRPSPEEVRMAHRGLHVYLKHRSQ